MPSVAVLSAAVLTLASGRAADWPAFRGPHSTGVAAESSAVTTWDDQQHVQWRFNLPRPGNGSPVVASGRVFVTSAEDADGKQRSLYCLEAATGQRLWVRTVQVERKFPTHDTNPYCGTTPVVSGNRVVVWHASGGLHCYDLAGELQWSRDLGEFQHMWGYGTSPIVHRDRIILHSGPGKRIFVAAFDLANGQTLWEHNEPQDGESDRNKEGKYCGSWTTPVVATVGGKEQVLVVLPTRVVAFDPASGQPIWWCEGVRHGRGDLAYSSPLVVGDVCFLTGGFNGAALAVRMTGTGDVTSTHRLWRKENNPQSIGSGVVVDGLVYRPNAGPATVECLDPLTGKVQWTERAGVGFWGSIVQVGGLLYVTDQDADTFVFKPNPQKMELVATNKLSGTSNATPAVSGGRLFLRTDKALICVGE
ncbi:MAG: PQQ-binding-like beta-propeller repeat protein [Pirellulales bacterium]